MDSSNDEELELLLLLAIRRRRRRKKRKINPLNAHAAKAKLTWQRVSCKQNQSDKILSMTGEADSKFVACSTHNHWL